MAFLRTADPNRKCSRCGSGPLLFMKRLCDSCKPVRFMRTARLDRKCRYCDTIVLSRKRVCDECAKLRCKRCRNLAVTGKRACAECAAKQKAEYVQRLAVDPLFRQQMRDRAKRNHWLDNEANKAKMKIRARNNHHRDKIEAIKHYDGCCVCCGESDYRFLTFDHSLGDGKAHRMSLCNGKHRTLGSAFVRKLRMSNWPDVPGLQVLCANCHMAKDNWGGCPHQEAKALISGETGMEETLKTL